MKTRDSQKVKNSRGSPPFALRQVGLRHRREEIVEGQRAPSAGLQHPLRGTDSALREDCARAGAVDELQRLVVPFEEHEVLSRNSTLPK